MIKRIVCLANSRKLSERCVAGRELLAEGPGSWIRPVSNRPGGEVSAYERQYENGSEPHLLDVMDVPLVEPRSKPNQPENWLLDRRRYWTKVDQLDYSAVASLVQNPDDLWVNGHHTSYNLNDVVLAEEADNIDSSLKLIAVSDLKLNVFTTGQGFPNPKRRVQADFRFSNVDYLLWVTDPPFEREYGSRHDGTYNLGARYLTISLGDLWEGRCFKLVAAIFGGLQ
jgi:hypothetical protein